MIDKLTLILSSPGAFVIVAPDTLDAFLRACRTDGPVVNDVSHVRVYTSPHVESGTIYAINPDSMNPPPEEGMLAQPGVEDHTEAFRAVLDTWESGGKMDA